MVEIHLHVDESYISFLSIPIEDVQRLSLRPLKWIRFVMFSICGGRGHLSTTPDGPPVDYTSTELTETEYYYKPEEDCIFIDYEALNDRTTPSALTQRASEFRAAVKRRDGENCVITGEISQYCDAAHLIPKSKGDEYINKVIDDRRTRYDPTPLLSISGINAVENGILLSKNLHSALRHGDVAFLRTPNFALETEDIPRFERGPAPAIRVTLHRLKSLNTFDLREAKRYCDWELSSGQFPDPAICYRYGLQVDAAFNGGGGTEHSQPHAVILDFVYGVASYALWKSKGTHSVLEKYRADVYSCIPIPLVGHSIDDVDSPDDVDDPRDGNFEAGSSGRSRIVEGGVRTGYKMARAMDEMNLVMMLLHGTTPEQAARRSEKRMEEEEQRSQKAGREKVKEWLQSDTDN